MLVAFLITPDGALLLSSRFLYSGLYSFFDSIYFRLSRSLAETSWKMVNQFPSENILTNKDLLAEVAMRSVKLEGRGVSSQEIANRGPLWLPTTFNLYYELPTFIKHFKEREAR